MQSIERQQFVACCMLVCHFLHMVVEAASSFRLVLTFEILLKYSWVLGNYIALDPDAMVNCVKMPCFLIQCPTIQSWSCFFTSHSISSSEAPTWFGTIWKPSCSGCSSHVLNYLRHSNCQSKTVNKCQQIADIDIFLE